MARKLKKYSPELKQQAVQDYISGHGSLRNICKKYGIKDKRQLRYWISCYNGHKEMRRPSGAKGEIYMTKGRKTTQEERAQIVAFCIEHGTDYALTVETYKVSYQQRTEAERQRQENKILQAKLKDKEMEIALLKKLRELRGGGWSAE